MQVNFNSSVSPDTQTVSQQPVSPEAAQPASGPGAGLPPTGHTLPPVASAKSQPGQQFDAAVKRLKQAIKETAPALKLTVELQSGYAVAKLIDPQSKKVLVQFPPEQVIQLARHPEKLSGALIRTRA